MAQKKSMAELERLSPTEYATAPKIPVSLVLDDIRSANNVGSMFRTADCLAIEHVYLCGITATPPHRDILKTALGASASVAWSYHDNATELIQELKAKGIKTFAVEQTHGSIQLRQFRAEGHSPLAIVLGNEVQGVQQSIIDNCDGCLEIEQFGTKHSFNVAIAAGLVLYELSGQLR
ncbi:RNA methyltransferase [Lewinella sp. 4G2]|uniref:RNA methyltransferase n=1 Tax=Lewinella sp. 4G2 TaxID=1803372 RepID=UPI0007B4B878|nr:RNA methyltransferase [Lewinella sp. 4G2]OAV44380.1 RNA methyltransferase [Lewinella sp. 4G2]